MLRAGSVRPDLQAPNSTVSYDRGASLHRTLSYTEISTAMTCQARWDFKYGGRLAGSTLKRKELATGLSEGRAWGAGVAALHQASSRGELTALWEAHEAIRASLRQDSNAMAASGFAPGNEQLLESENRLSAMLDHYAETTEPFQNLTQLEAEIVVPVPARSGRRASTMYRFQCFLDGFTDEGGQPWLVEFKLRNRLMDPALLERQRQYRWYAFAWSKKHGRVPAGIYVDERLNEVPKPARILASGKVSHAKDQMTTPELYAAACHECGELPKLEVSESLRARQWQQRFPLQLRPSELDTAGGELTSAAKLIRDLDRGEVLPIRNASRANCSMCDFRDVCSEPGDQIYVDQLFDRTEPKRLRTPKEEAA
jgi:hypothetical protein